MAHLDLNPYTAPAACEANPRTPVKIAKWAVWIWGGAFMIAGLLSGPFICQHAEVWVSRGLVWMLYGGVEI